MLHFGNIKSAGPDATKPSTPAVQRKVVRAPPSSSPSPSARADAPLPPSLLLKFNRFIGNVNNLSVTYTDEETGVTTPPLLKCDASFESGVKPYQTPHAKGNVVAVLAGNLGKVEAVSPFEFDLYIRADVANQKCVEVHMSCHITQHMRRHRNWFYFAVTETSRNQRVIFNVVNFSKSKRLPTLAMGTFIINTALQLVS